MNKQSQKIERLTVRFSTDDMKLIEQLAEKDNRPPVLRRPVCSMLHFHYMLIIWNFYNKLPRKRAIRGGKSLA